MKNNKKIRIMSHMELINSMTLLDAIIKNYVEEESSTTTTTTKHNYLFIYLMELKNSTVLSLTEIGLKIIDLFIEHRALTSEEISKRLKCSRRHARNICNKLMVEMDLLKIVERNRVHIYVLNTATEVDITRASAVWDTIKHSFSEKYRSTLGATKSLFKCVDCKTVFKAMELKPCPECNKTKIVVYVPS